MSWHIEKADYHPFSVTYTVVYLPPGYISPYPPYNGVIPEEDAIRAQREQHQVFRFKTEVLGRPQAEYYNANVNYPMQYYQPQPVEWNPHLNFRFLGLDEYIYGDKPPKPTDGGKDDPNDPNREGCQR